MKFGAMKSAFAVLVAAASLGLLSACATPTPYQPAANTTYGYHPGYTETKIEDGRYLIGFSGNDLTSRDTVENSMLYRAAELTLANGYDWFEIVKRDTQTQKRTISSPSDPFMNNLSWRFYRGNRWGAWGMFGDDFDRDTFESTRYEAGAEVLMHKGAKPEGNAQAYDARSVKQNLEPKIVRPAPAH